MSVIAAISLLVNKLYRLLETPLINTDLTKALIDIKQYIMCLCYISPRNVYTKTNRWSYYYTSYIVNPFLSPFLYTYIVKVLHIIEDFVIDDTAVYCCCRLPGKCRIRSNRRTRGRAGRLHICNRRHTAVHISLD